MGNRKAGKFRKKFVNIRQFSKSLEYLTFPKEIENIRQLTRRLAWPCQLEETVSF